MNRPLHMLWPPATRLHKGVALLLAAVTLIVALLAASPAAHEWLHADAGHADHVCAVTLFAHGVTAALPAVLLSLVTWRLVGSILPRTVEIDLTAPRYQLLPGRAPPGC